MNMHESFRFISKAISLPCIFSFLISATTESELLFDSLFQSDEQHGTFSFFDFLNFIIKKPLANKLKHHKPNLTKMELLEMKSLPPSL